MSLNVLKEIGGLSSQQGRKAEGKDNPLQPEECCFLETATATIIRRMAEKAHDPDACLREITMADLTPLP